MFDLAEMDRICVELASTEGRFLGVTLLSALHTYKDRLSLHPKLTGFMATILKQVRMKLWSVVYSEHLNPDNVLFWQGKLTIPLAHNMSSSDYLISHAYEGDEGHAFYILLKGCVKVYVNERVGEVPHP
jgi:hypothetical protein